MRVDDPGVTRPSAMDADPPLRVLLGVGDPERERRLIEALDEDGFTLAGRALDAPTLVEQARGAVDATVASSDLHRLTPTSLLAVRELGVPLVLLADLPGLERYRDLAYLLPLDTPAAEVRQALTEAVGRGPLRAARADAAREAIDPTGDDGETRGRITALTGGKGAPGATTIAVALAGALARRGRDVLLVDADLRLGAVGAHLDLDPRRSLFTLAYGQRPDRDDWAQRLEEEVQDAPGFAVLNGIDRAEQRAEVGSEVMIAALTAARRRYQEIVVDAGAVIEGFTLPAGEAALRLAARVLLVAQPDLPGLWNARGALLAMRDSLGVPADRLALALNRRAGREHYVAAEVERALAVPVLATVPRDERLVRRAVAEQLPLTLAGRRGAAKAVRRLAAVLMESERTARPRRARSLTWRRVRA